MITFYTKNTFQKRDLFQVLVKELVNTSVFVIPGIFILKTMSLSRIHHHLKILISGLDKNFDVLYRILKSNIVIGQAMKGITGCSRESA